jgi:O-antigen ligase
MVFPLATALLVFFQIEVPVLGDTITVSPADLIAAICGVLILLEAIKTPRQFFSAIPLYGCIASVAFLAAYLHGVYSFGVTPWATSKFIGWFVLLSYCGAGAMLASAIDLGGIRRLALTISIALAVIVVFSLIVTFPNGFSSLGLAGFAGNRNAFAFQLVICMAAGLAVLRDHPYWRIIAIALAFGIFSAGSFAGFGTLAIICVTSLYFYPRDWLSLVFPLAVGCVLYFAMVVALSRFEAPQTLAMFAHYQSSDAEHWLSMRAGLALFMTHPLMGSGLGYFYDHVLPEESGPLVIHNVAIWILAEFGIGGLLLALGFIVHMVRAIIASWPSQAAELALLAGLMFGAFGMAHDIFYQRSFWFVLGAALAGLNAAPTLLWSARRRAAPLA